MRPLRPWPQAAALLLFTALPQIDQAAGLVPGPEAAYLKENDVAMTKMMDAMTVNPTGDIDRDFVAMMAPHHQGAIDMAQAELRYGKNEQLRRIAQEIVVEQQQEIVAMRMALGQTLPPSVPAPDQIGATRAASTASAAHSNSAMHMQMNHSGQMSPTREN